MCELFGVNAVRPYTATPELREFYSHSERHPHGWGLSWRNGDTIELFKEPVRAIDSSLLKRDLLTRSIAAEHLIGHIRKATHGNPCFVNCHPFVLQDSAGRDWIMAHNGVMLNEARLCGYDEWEEGQTDSERIFLFLMDVLELAYGRSGRSDFDVRFAALASALAELSNGNRVNVLLDDGEYLYAHSNTMSETLRYLALDGAVLVSTEPLDDRPWQPVPKCRLVAFKDGQLVRQGQVHNHVFLGCNLDGFKLFA